MEPSARKGIQFRESLNGENNMQWNDTVWMEALNVWSYEHKQIAESIW